MPRSRSRVGSRSSSKSKRSSRTIVKTEVLKVKEKRVDVYEQISSDEFENELESDLDAEDSDAIKKAQTSTYYFMIKKLIEILRIANPSTSVLLLIALQDCPIHTIVGHQAIISSRAISLLINLLDIDNTRCHIGSLKILRVLVKTSSKLRRTVVSHKSLPAMMNLLDSLNPEIKMLVAETFSYLSRYKIVRPLVRKKGGLPMLIDMLVIPKRVLRNKYFEVNHEDKILIRSVKCAAYALWALCRENRKNKEEIHLSGVMLVLRRLVATSFIKMVVPIIGLLQECASEEGFQILIMAEGLLEPIIRHLNYENLQLKMLCSQVLFKCADGEQSKEIIGNKALKILVNILLRKDIIQEKYLIIGTTGAIWKCSLTPKFAEDLMQYDAIPILVGLLNHQCEEVLINVIGTIAQCAKNVKNCDVIRKYGTVERIIELRTSYNPNILKHIADALGACAEDKECLKIIYEMDGVRRLWSMLKNKNEDVICCATWALCPCIRSDNYSGQLIRTLLGGLELLVKALQSKNAKVITATCALICNVGKDSENLGVLTDYEVVKLLSDLKTENDYELQKYQSSAIAVCSPYKSNSREFGERGIIPLIASYLKHSPIDVKMEAIAALYGLSFDSNNCFIMNEYGVEEILLSRIKESSSDLVKIAAKCLENIRKLAYEIDIDLWYERRHKRFLKLQKKKKHI